jgi:4-hydroxy-2-oxoheptanedioate aldolase
MLPRARSAKQVSDAVSGARYSPTGVRGFDPTVSAYSYGAGNGHGVPRIIVQIETREALQTVADIAAVDEVSDVFLGPADLSRDLNGPGGDYFAPEVLDAMKSVAATVAGTGVGLGAYVDTPERAGWAAGLGYSLLAVGSDVAFLSGGAAVAATTMAATT